MASDANTQVTPVTHSCSAWGLFSIICIYTMEAYFHRGFFSGCLEYKIILGKYFYCCRVHNSKSYYSESGICGIAISWAHKVAGGWGGGTSQCLKLLLQVSFAQLSLYAAHDEN